MAMLALAGLAATSLYSTAHGPVIHLGYPLLPGQAAAGPVVAQRESSFSSDMLVIEGGNSWRQTLGMEGGYSPPPREDILHLLPRRAASERLLPIRAARRYRPEADLTTRSSSAQLSAVANPLGQSSTALTWPATLLFKISRAVRQGIGARMHALGRHFRSQWNRLRRLFCRWASALDRLYSKHPFAVFLLVTTLLAFSAEWASALLYSPLCG